MMTEHNMAGLTNEVNPDLFVGLPFSLPATKESDEWLHELDFIDVRVGDLDELRDLAERAPTVDARQWLQSMISVRAYQELFLMPV